MLTKKNLTGLIVVIIVALVGSVCDAAQVAAKGDQPAPAALDVVVVGSIGGLKPGASEAQLRAVAGKGAKLRKGKEEILAATDLAHQRWTFAEIGLAADMTSEKVGGAKSVWSITIKAPSPLKTGRGVGIGSTKADVVKAYAGFFTDPEGQKFFAGRDVHLVGELTGGMIFTFKNGKVSEIFFGAAAE